MTEGRQVVPVHQFSRRHRFKGSRETGEGFGRIYAEEVSSLIRQSPCASGLTAAAISSMPSVRADLGIATTSGCDNKHAAATCTGQSRYLHWRCLKGVRRRGVIPFLDHKAQSRVVEISNIRRPCEDGNPVTSQRLDARLNLS